MTYYALTGLTNAFASVILGLFVYFKNRKSKVNRLFFLVTLSVTIWGCFYFLWQISATKEAALFWSRALMAGAIFTPITFFHFIIVFLNKYKKYKKLLIFGYVVCLILLLSDFTPLLVKDVSLKLSFPYWPNPGATFHLFCLIFFGYFFYSWFLLKKAHSQASLIKQFQIKYILFGSIIGVLSGLTNFLLWYDIPVPPFLNGLTASFVIFITYAVVKHHLMNVKVIATELLVGIVAIVLLIDFFLSRSLAAAAIKGILFTLFLYLGWSLIRSVLQEIERREKMERMSKQLRGAYQELKKLDIAKSEFIAMASHQLRTPLSIIKGYVSMLIEGSYGEPPQRFKKPLKGVFDSSQRLLRIINDLLDISKVELGKLEVSKEKVQIEDLIDGVVEELMPEAEKKGIDLQWEKPEKRLSKIEVDSLKISQVIACVVDNAIKYTKKGEVKVKCQMSDSKCQIVVKDTGVGMSKDEKEKIFESFTRGEAGINLWIQGTGLGLYLAKKYVELHNGKIWAESAGKNKGSTFYIELPKK